MPTSASLSWTRGSSVHWLTAPQNNRESNLKLAFNVLQTYYNVPPLLDPEDLLGGQPDERSVMAYVYKSTHAQCAPQFLRRYVALSLKALDDVKQSGAMPNLSATMEPTKPSGLMRSASNTCTVLGTLSLTVTLTHQRRMS